MAEYAEACASALYALAGEAGRGEQALEGLQLVSETLRAHPDYLELLASPDIPMEDRARALDAAFAAHLPDAVRSGLKVMIEQGKIRELPAVADIYARMWAQNHAETTARVISAEPLSREEERRLKKRLEEMSGKRVSMTVEIDPALLGGMTVMMDGRLWDGSLRRRMQDIKDVISR